MKILVNALPLKDVQTGVQAYLRNLYRAIEEYSDARVEYYNGERASGIVPASHRQRRRKRLTELLQNMPAIGTFVFRAFHWLWYEYRLRIFLCREHFDIYHESTLAPALTRGHVPQIFTLHDLSAMRFQEIHPRERVWFCHFFLRRRTSHVAHIITPSEYIKQEACTFLGISPDMVTAVPEAADPFFRNRSRKSIHEMLFRLNLPRPYLLFVGTLEPRKNLDVFIEAMRYTQNDIPAVLTGWKGWGDKPWLEKIKAYSLEDRVFMTGYVDKESLACLYSGATALVFPSLYEGFGLPVLEAMACGCPVICSNAASLPEVAGNAAVFFDPRNPRELAAAIDKVAEDRYLRASIIEKGYGRCTKFTWEHTALRTLDIFEEVIKGGLTSNSIRF